MNAAQKKSWANRNGAQKLFDKDYKRISKTKLSDLGAQEVVELLYTLGSNMNMHEFREPDDSSEAFYQFSKGRMTGGEFSKPFSREGTIRTEHGSYSAYEFFKGYVKDGDRSPVIHTVSREMEKALERFSFLGVQNVVLKVNGYNPAHIEAEFQFERDFHDFGTEFYSRSTRDAARSEMEEWLKRTLGNKREGVNLLDQLRTATMVSRYVNIAGGYSGNQAHAEDQLLVRLDDPFTFRENHVPSLNLMDSERGSHAYHYISKGNGYEYRYGKQPFSRNTDMLLPVDITKSLMKSPLLKNCVGEIRSTLFENGERVQVVLKTRIKVEA